VYELVARAAGRVIELVVDEGQLVAEEDTLALLEDGGARVPLRTDVPGVVRELYLDIGRLVMRGEVVALIDEA
jgi:multidrug efflux pump subunit AcrA (membrane-fusion protein)